MNINWFQISSLTKLASLPVFELRFCTCCCWNEGDFYNRRPKHAKSFRCGKYITSKKIELKINILWSCEHKKQDVINCKLIFNSFQQLLCLISVRPPVWKEVFLALNWHFYVLILISVVCGLNWFSRLCVLLLLMFKSVRKCLIRTKLSNLIMT